VNKELGRMQLEAVAS